MKLATEVHFQADLHERDVLGGSATWDGSRGPWMMVGTHAGGATLALFDGAPDYPGPMRLWDFAEHHGLTFLGVSPTLLRALHAQGAEPPSARALASLRMFGCAGEPLDPEAYRYLFEVVGRRNVRSSTCPGERRWLPASCRATSRFLTRSARLDGRHLEWLSTSWRPTDAPFAARWASLFVASLGQA